MQRKLLLAATLAAVATVAGADTKQDKDKNKAEPAVAAYFRNDDSGTDGFANGVSYHAIAGTIVVHPKGWDDVTQSAEAEPGPPPNPQTEVAEKGPSPQKETGARAAMF